MSERTAAAALDLLLRSRRRVLALGFYGGEPLLAFDLVRRTIEEAERRRPRGRRLELSLSTNGLLLDPDRAAFLAAHDVRTQLSFDGSREAQELRSPGTHDAVGAILDRLRWELPEFYEGQLEVAVTVGPANIGSLAESVAQLLERDIRKITLGPLLGACLSWDRALERQLEAQLRLVYRRSLSLYERTGRVPLTLFRRTIGRPVASRRGAMCGIGRGDSVTVDVDGEVCGCPLGVRSYQTLSAPGLRRWVAPLRIGRVDAPDLADGLGRFAAEVRRSPLFAQRERKGSLHGRCVECPHRASCVVCPVAIALAGEDPHRVPEFLCAFNRLSSKYRDRFPPQWDLPPPSPRATPRRSRRPRTARRPPA
jgi:MoaA/NifB/PqqE/SkfB family radical SAM enzyme